jgi:hypothetical protein
MLERLNEEIRRRTHVVRIFPNGQSCLRLVRTLAVETHENWLEQHRYLNMDDLREHKRRRCAVLPDPRPIQPSTVLALSIGMGASRDATPPTPPGIRVRTTAVRPI